jgi:hypothetical protein
VVFVKELGQAVIDGQAEPAPTIVYSPS